AVAQPRSNQQPASNAMSRTDSATSSSDAVSSTDAAEPEAALATSAAPEPTQPIDLSAVLRLAGANAIDLALVAEAEQRARAANSAAVLAFFPWLGVGTGYDRHSGAETALGKLYGVQSELYNSGVS